MGIMLKDLKIKLFADGADKAQILDMAKQSWIRGFTTNPSLMKLAGVSDYQLFARELVEAVPNHPISFEVFSDEISEMLVQAKMISALGANVYVKLPVTTTRGEPLYEAVCALSQDGVKVNLTAIFAAEQVAGGVKALAGGAPACVSVFAGRLADVGIDYRPIMRDAIARSREVSNVEIIWASTREVFNVIEANEMSCDIITVPPSLLKRLPSLGSKSASELSLDAVKAFREDAVSAGLKLPAKMATAIGHYKTGS
jgi:transaldolase